MCPAAFCFFFESTRCAIHKGIIIVISIYWSEVDVSLILIIYFNSKRCTFLHPQIMLDQRREYITTNIYCPDIFSTSSRTIQLRYGTWACVRHEVGWTAKGYDIIYICKLLRAHGYRVLNSPVIDSLEKPTYQSPNVMTCGYSSTGNINTHRTRCKRHPLNPMLLT